METIRKDKDYLLLGPSGFIGTHLFREFGLEKSQTLKHFKDISSLSRPKQDHIIVINSSASPFSAAEEESWESNYKRPKEILATLLTRYRNITWIQFSSYFELQIEYGRSDFYSLHKAKFSADLLAGNFGDSITPQIIYLPHVFGRGERSSRLISSLLGALRTQHKVNIKNPNDYLPLISIDDFIAQIKTHLKSVEGEIITLPKPFWYGEIKTLIDLIATSSEINLFSFDPINEGVNSKFPKLTFPSMNSSQANQIGSEALREYLFNAYQ